MFRINAPVSRVWNQLNYSVRLLLSERTIQNAVFLNGDVQLMGSPTTDYPDILQALAGTPFPSLYSISALGANAMPQENLTLPLANEVPGLADYFNSLIDENPPFPTEEKKDVQLNIEAGSTRSLPEIWIEFSTAA